MKTISELEAEEARLWEEYKALKEPADAKAAEWQAVRQEINERNLRDKIRAEVLAEQKP